jgi:thioredoxin-related protein
MKKMIFVLFVFSAVSFSQGLPWKKFNDGMAEAKVSGKKVLVDVYADWCKWCKKMDAVTYADKKVTSYLEKNYVLIKLNAEGTESITYLGKTISPSDFAQKMGVDGYPATLFLKSNGDPITIAPGYSEPGMFIHVVQYIGDNQIGKKNFDQYLAEKAVK